MKPSIIEKNRVPLIFSIFIKDIENDITSASLHSSHVDTTRLHLASDREEEQEQEEQEQEEQEQEEREQEEQEQEGRMDGWMM